MFKSSGYFKGVNCPYFSNGLCERTYCHFRHVKPDSYDRENISSENESEVSSGSSVLGIVSSAIKQVNRDSCAPPQTTSVFQKLESVKWYKPTPIPKLVQSRHRHGNNANARKQNIPEYNPTPIHVLKSQAAKPQEYVPSGPESSKSTPEYKPSTRGAPPADTHKLKGDASSLKTSVPAKKERSSRSGDEKKGCDPLQGSRPSDIPSHEPTPGVSPLTVQSHSDIPESLISTKRSNGNLTDDIPVSLRDTAGSEKPLESAVTSENNRVNHVDGTEKQRGTDAKISVEENSQRDCVTEKENHESTSLGTGSNLDAGKIIVGDLSAVTKKDDQDQPKNEISIDASSSACSDDVRKHANEAAVKVKTEVTDTKQSSIKEEGKSIEDNLVDDDVIIVEKKEVVEVIVIESAGEDKDETKKRTTEKTEKSSPDSSKKDHRSRRKKRKRSRSRSGERGHKSRSRSGERGHKSRSRSGERGHKSRSRHKSSRTSKDKKSSKKRSSRSKSSHSAKKKNERTRKSRSSSSSREHSSSCDEEPRPHAKLKQRHSSSTHGSKRSRDSSRRKSSSKHKKRRRHDSGRSGSSSIGSHDRREDKVEIKLEKLAAVQSNMKNASTDIENSLSKLRSTANGARDKSKNIFETIMLSGGAVALKKENPNNGSEKDAKTGSKAVDNQTTSVLSDNEKGKAIPKSKTGTGTLNQSKHVLQKTLSCADLFGEESDSDSNVNKSGPDRNKPVTSNRMTSDSTSKSASNAPADKAKKGFIHVTLLKERDSDSSSIALSASDDETGNTRLNGDLVIEKPVVHMDTSEEMETEIPQSVLADLENEMSEEDPFDECYLIYNEAKSKSGQAAIRREREARAEKTRQSFDEDSTPAMGKVRKARTSESHMQSSLQRRIASARPGAQPSPAQVLHNRLLALQNRTERKRSIDTDQSDSYQLSSAKKQRLAHQPASTLAQGVSGIQSKPRIPEGKHEPTPCGTVSKLSQVGSSSKRQAHVPAVKKVNIPRPTVPEEFGSKIPTNVRQVYLNKIIDECLKIYPAEQDAYDRALAEEKEAYGRSGTRKIYLNVAVNCIAKLRQEAVPKSPTVSPCKNPRGMSHRVLLGGAKALTNHYTIKRSSSFLSPNKELTESEFYERLRQYVLTDEEQIENSYPRPDPSHPKLAAINTNDERFKNRISPHKLERICNRCGKRFGVEENGQCVRHDTCAYHWGKSYKKRITKGVFENKWTCCGGDVSTKGCQVASAHVHEQNKYEDLKGYVRMLEASNTPLDGNYGVYALDCEMVYTSMGMEIARVTVVDMKGKPVLEQLILPNNPVLDYNTRFSGISEADMKGVAICLRDVHAMLMGLLNKKTILIGHSLESDLIALKMFHDNVVDTSVVFPHRLGRPYKRALKTLMAEILQRIIQEDVGGHDSLEDAVSCMDLMKWKVKEDIKKEMRQNAQAHP